ncbi:MAG: hypothetical protein V4727_03990 [Verrucomicrobiota bacterium]
MKKLLNSRLSKNLLGAGCALLIVGVAEAKPDKSNGKGDKGGGPDHAEKHSDKGDKDKEDKGNDKDHKDHKHEDKDKNAKYDEKAEPWRAHRFEDKERTVLLDYFKGYESQPQGLPPGLAKNLRRGKPLPPGWQKKVNEGYIVDDETYGLFDALEDSLFPNLRPKPDTKLYLYGDRVVRVYEPKRQVIDIFPIPGIKLN